MKKKVTRRHEGGRVNCPPSILKSIQPIDMKLGMCNKCPVYFQLSGHVSPNWLPWQPQQHSYVTSGRHLGFSNFQFFFHIQI